MSLDKRKTDSYGDQLFEESDGPHPLNFDADYERYLEALENGTATIADSYLLRNTQEFTVFTDRLGSYARGEVMPRRQFKSGIEMLRNLNRGTYDVAKHNARLIGDLTYNGVEVNHVLEMIANSSLDRHTSALYPHYNPTEFEIMARNALQSTFSALRFDFMGRRRNTDISKAHPREETFFQTLVNGVSSVNTLLSILEITSEIYPERVQFVESLRGFINEIEVSISAIEGVRGEAEKLNNPGDAGWYFPSAFIEDVDIARIDGYFLFGIDDVDSKVGMSPIDIKLSKGKTEPTPVETSLGHIAMRVNAKTIGNIDENGNAVCGRIAASMMEDFDNYSVESRMYNLQVIDSISGGEQFSGMQFSPQSIEESIALGLALSGNVLPDYLFELKPEEIVEHKLEKYPVLPGGRR